MTNTITSVSFITAGIVVAALFVFALPSFALAANYAYVNHSGEVQMVTASTPTAAINTAPGISLHSGVILLNSATDNDIVGDNVSGM